MLAFQILGPVLADDVHAGLGERRHLLDRHVFRSDDKSPVAPPRRGVADIGCRSL
jgi:hypothetical protein